jgi:transposase-like protein
MSKSYQQRSLLAFQQEFATEEACQKHLLSLRWLEGFACPRCGHTAHWLISTRGLLTCKKCRRQTSVTAGTAFHKTRTPLLKWYWLLYHMAMAKVGVSVAQIQRMLEIKDYKTAWLMAHKVRKAMADRDAKYTLAGLAEMDETFFGKAGTRAGRGSEHKVVVLCAVSLYRDNKGKDRPGFAQMAVVDDASAESVKGFLERLGCGPSTTEGRQLLSAIRTDGWRSYTRAAKDKRLEHCRVVLSNPKDAGRLLPFVHNIITQAKCVTGGTHRGVSSKHLQKYLNEVCYRFNRRFWEKELFDRLVTASVTTDTVTYDQLVKGIPDRVS